MYFKIITSMNNQEIINIKIEDLVLWTENPRDPISPDLADQDVAVLDAFVDFYSKFPTSSSPHLCDRFCDDYATYRDYVDTTYDWMYLKRTLWSMEIIVDEMDITDPSNFFLLCSELDKVIKKQKKS